MIKWIVENKLPNLMLTLKQVLNYVKKGKLLFVKKVKSPILAKSQNSQ